jgi:hypothetical protein
MGVELKPVPKPVKQPKKKKAKKKKSPETLLIGKIDDIDSMICLIEAGYVCMKCGGQASMNHHFFHKSSHGAVRFDKRNHCPVCFGCHQYRIHAAGETEEIRDKIIAKIGQDQFDDLKFSAFNRLAERSMPYLRLELAAKKKDLLIAVSNADINLMEIMSAAARKRFEIIEKEAPKLENNYDNLPF